MTSLTRQECKAYQRNWNGWDVSYNLLMCSSGCTITIVLPAFPTLLHRESNCIWTDPHLYRPGWGGGWCCWRDYLRLIYIKLKWYWYSKLHPKIWKCSALSMTQKFAANFLCMTLASNIKQLLNFIISWLIDIFVCVEQEGKDAPQKNCDWQSGVWTSGGKESKTDQYTASRTQQKYSNSNDPWSYRWL